MSDAALTLRDLGENARQAALALGATIETAPNAVQSKSLLDWSLWLVAAALLGLLILLGWAFAIGAAVLKRIVSTWKEWQEGRGPRAPWDAADVRL